MFSVAQSEDSPVAMKLKKMWLKTPVGEEQAAQAVLDPALGKSILFKNSCTCGRFHQCPIYRCVHVF